MNKEELIFELYKDRSIGARKLRRELKTKYNINDDKKITEIYIRINNYQINKYGGRISVDVELLNRNECIRRSSLRRMSKWNRLKRIKNI